MVSYLPNLNLLKAAGSFHATVRQQSLPSVDRSSIAQYIFEVKVNKSSPGPNSCHALLLKAVALLVPNTKSASTCVRSACFFFHHRPGSKDTRATKVNVDSATTTSDDTHFHTTPFETALFRTTTVDIPPFGPRNFDIANTLTIALYNWHLQTGRNNQDHDIPSRGHERS